MDDSSASREAILAAAYAESIARDHAARGKSVSDLLSAFAGLVASGNAGLASECLIALEGASSGVSANF